MSNLQLRVISALVLATVVLSLTFVGGTAFRGLSALIGAAMFYEWALINREKLPLWAWVLTACALAIVLAALILNVSADTLLLVIGGMLAVLIICELISARSGWAGGGFLYAALSAISLGQLRGDDSSGLMTILFLFAVVWATDILAYFTGRALGGPKLAPAISPGKTISGGIGGAVAGVIAGVVVTMFAPSAALWAIIAIALFLSVVSQIGDLFESAIKRRAGVKDSSNLIPGHGGVLDRVDGLVAASMALYLLTIMTTGFTAPSQLLFPMP